MTTMVCGRCETALSFDNVTLGYFAYCPEHDEDLYQFEIRDGVNND